MRTAKAWVAGIGAVTTALGAAFADDVLDTGDVSNVVSVVIFTVATLVAVYKTRNAGTVNGSDPVDRQTTRL